MSPMTQITPSLLPHDRSNRPRRFTTASQPPLSATQTVRTKWPSIQKRSASTWQTACVQTAALHDSPRAPPGDNHSRQPAKTKAGGCLGHPPTLQPQPGRRPPEIRSWLQICALQRHLSCSTAAIQRPPHQTTAMLI